MLEAVRAERARRAAEADRQLVERDAEAIRARCRTLAGFVREAWHVLEPSTTYVHGWHIDAICEHLEAVTDGRITRLLINVPPGSMKSLLVSVFWPAWEWTQPEHRAKRYLTTSFSENNAKRDTRKMRDLVQSTWFQTLWPDVKLVRAGEMSFANSATGNRECAAFGSLTGQRGDRLIIDDPHSTETAESDAEREATTRKFREGALNRLNDQVHSAIVVIMQRLHEDDLTGVALKLRMPWVHLMLPMEFDPARPCSTVIGFRDPRTKAGELLDPARFPAQTVEELKADMGPYAWAGQYQQAPGPRDGAFFERAWFRRYRPGDQPRDLRYYITSDHAPTAGPRSDSNGARVWGIDERGDVWMIAGRKGRMRMDELAALVIGNIRDQHRPPEQAPVEGLIRQWKPHAWFPEDDNNWKAVEPFVVRRLREEKVSVRIEPISPRGQDKATKAQAAQAMAASGRVHYPEGPDGDEAIQELIGFPTAAHDEEVDLLAIICRALDMAHPAIVRNEGERPLKQPGRRDYRRADSGGDGEWMAA